MPLRDGEPLVTDGPFAETKEVLGGFYLVDAERRRGARVGARIPTRPMGAIEVRPIVDHSGGGRIDDLARAYRDDRARCIAILGRVLGDLDLAEDAVQDAFVRAAERWPRNGSRRTPARGSSRPRATARST